MNRLRAAVDRAAAHPYAIFTLLAIVLWRVGITRARGEGLDWDTMVQASHGLTGSVGLHIYGQRPDLTFGPLSLVAAVPLRYLGPNLGWPGTSAILFAAAVGCLWFLRGAARHAGVRDDLRARCALLVGGVFTLLALDGPAAFWGHPDDVFTLLAVSAAVWASAQRRWVLASVMVGVAAGFKPWGIFVLALAAHGDLRRWRGPLLALVVAVLPWLPFIAADRGTLNVSHIHVAVFPSSGLRLLDGLGGASPGWAHTLQLVVAIGAGAIALARGRWELIPLVAYVARVELDPATFSYYNAGLVLGAFAADLISPLSLPALRTVSCWVLAYGVPDLAGQALSRESNWLDLIDFGSRVAIILAVAALSGNKLHDAAGRRRVARPEPGSSP